MLNQRVFIFNSTSIGSGQYTLDLYFKDTSKAKYLSLGDYVRDTNSNEYEIVSGTFPHIDGSQVTVEFRTVDTPPLDDSDYNSNVFTPGQINYQPEVQTPGNLFNISLFDSTNYEYTVETTWDISSEASKAAVGDRIVDESGTEYEITFLDPTQRFSFPIRIKEVEEVGNLPNAGIATLYRTTSQLNLFLGSALTDPARTVIRNRDNVILDNAIGSQGSQNGDYEVYTITLSSTEISNKGFNLPHSPLEPSEVILNIADGLTQEYNVDFTVSGTLVSWDGYQLDGDLTSGDKLTLVYFR